MLGNGNFLIYRTADNDHKKSKYESNDWERQGMAGGAPEYRKTFYLVDLLDFLILEDADSFIDRLNELEIIRDYRKAGGKVKLGFGDFEEVEATKPRELYNEVLDRWRKYQQELKA